MLLHMKDKHTKMMLMVIKETKRDILKNESTPSAQHVTNPEGLVSHLSQVVQRVISYQHYIGLLKYKQAITELQKYKKSTSMMKIKNKHEGTVNVMKQPALCQNYTPQ